MVPISMPFVLKFSIFVVIICVCVEFQDVSAGKGMIDCMIDHDYDGEYFLLCFCEATEWEAWDCSSCPDSGAINRTRQICCDDNTYRTRKECYTDCGYGNDTDTESITCMEACPGSTVSNVALSNNSPRTDSQCGTGCHIGPLKFNSDPNDASKKCRIYNNMLLF